MNRRNFLKTLGLIAAFTGFRLSANSLNNPSFLHGVASGDPTDTNVILWSRVTTNSQSSIKVLYEVAEDKNFVNIFLKGQKFTGKRNDFTVKIDAKIPKKYRGKKIFYRFRSGNSISETGSTMTLPKIEIPLKLQYLVAQIFQVDTLMYTETLLMINQLI